MPILCKNAYEGMSAWYCLDFAGNRWGTVELNEGGECQACAKVSATIETLPSFMTNEDGDN